MLPAALLPLRVRVPIRSVEFTNEVGSTGTRADLFTAFGDGACCTWAQSPCHISPHMLQWCEVGSHPPTPVSCCGAFAKAHAGQVEFAHAEGTAVVQGSLKHSGRGGWPGESFAYEWNSPRARRPLTTQTHLHSAAVMRLLIGQQRMHRQV